MMSDHSGPGNGTHSHSSIFWVLKVESDIGRCNALRRSRGNTAVQSGENTDGPARRAPFSCVDRKTTVVLGMRKTPFKAGDREEVARLV